MTPVTRTLGRLVGLLVLSILALQLTFAARIAAMSFLDPGSTAFERSEAWRLATSPPGLDWHQDWVDYGRVSKHLPRAVIASEDAAFTDHAGIDWDAIEKAWDRNQRTETKIVGGSTITQQLAKNLFLSGERNVVRKAQELLLTLMLEGLLTKQRILEIYLNHVEWGEGVFGAQAAARHYYRIDAAQLGPTQAARLAVMLPAPKRFEKRPGSPYVVGRAATIVTRMGDVETP
jgi:monofunctional biosynthetic peptidoglycan transglycosylase